MCVFIDVHFISVHCLHKSTCIEFMLFHFLCLPRVEILVFNGRLPLIVFGVVVIIVVHHLGYLVLIFIGGVIRIVVNFSRLLLP